jgi:hypothetical protein
MNRRGAIQYLHERHRDVIDAPESDVDLEALHLEVFWFQAHVCELIDGRADLGLRRCFATVHHLLVHGDDDVRDAVWGDFVIPHLVMHPDLAWAKERMPQLLADVCDRAREVIARGTLPGAPGPRVPMPRTAGE